MTLIGYTEDIKSECLEMYVNGLGFRAIERVKKVHHTTIINWVKQVGSSLPDTPYRSEIPEVTEVDEQGNLCWLKKNKIWLWTAVNHSVSGIIAWFLGDRSSETFKHLWIVIKCWKSYSG